MLEASDGNRLTLLSPVAGEVLALNEHVLAAPSLLLQGQGRSGDGEPRWLIEVDPLVGVAEAAASDDWLALRSA